MLSSLAEPLLQCEADGGRNSANRPAGRRSQLRRMFRGATMSIGCFNQRRTDRPIDILVNSAGVNARDSIGELSEADWDAVLDVNLKGPFLFARRFGPPMAERGWGRIVMQFGSIMSTCQPAGRTPYASSKAGILGLTRTLALEWAARA